MKRLKTRKNIRIANPVAFALLIAGILLGIGVIAVVITLAIGYGPDLVKQAEASIQGTVDNLNEQATFTPEPTAVPTDTPEPVVTPEVGTPTPSATPTPEPIGNLTDTPEPTTDTTAPLYGVTVGINPMRDKSAGYDDECAFNLEFAQKLAEYLEGKGATVVLTRESNSVTISAKNRGLTIKKAKADIALEIVCNHIKSGASGCYVRYGTKATKAYAQELATAYQATTGIKFQNNHSNGLYNKTEDTIANAGCPCVRLVLGNWESKSDRAVIEDESMQQKIFETIYKVFVNQVGTNG